jgi:uncharacterized protein (TIGR02145 family)
MKSIIGSITHRFLLLGQFLILLYSCEAPEQSPNPDYTGQTGHITDIEGSIYNTIGIGSQIWMVENLKATSLNDGTPITQIFNDSIWNRIKSPGYCWYNNDSLANGNIYGALYNFYTIETGLLCPTGWHVPGESEWNILATFLGGNEIAGGKLKDYTTPYWKGTNICIVNNFDFSALPGGQRRNITGRFDEIGVIGYWWTSTSNEDNFAYSRSMSNSSLKLDSYINNKKCGFSIRCLKDQ